MKGSRYIVFKRGSRWYWALWLEHHGRIAFCKEDGYASQSGAEKAIESAHKAARWAIDDIRPHKPSRIDRDPSKDQPA